MKKIILILILLLRGTHSIAGVGDVYNCKGFTEEAGMTFSGRNLEFNRYPPDDKFIFEWEESGISYIVDNPSSLSHGEKYLFKFKVSLVSDQGEFFITDNGAKEDNISKENFAFVLYSFRNGSLMYYRGNFAGVWAQRYVCEKS